MCFAPTPPTSPRKWHMVAKYTWTFPVLSEMASTFYYDQNVLSPRPPSKKRNAKEKQNGLHSGRTKYYGYAKSKTAKYRKITVSGFTLSYSKVDSHTKTAFSRGFPKVDHSGRSARTYKGK